MIPEKDPCSVQETMTEPRDDALTPSVVAELRTFMAEVRESLETLTAKTGELMATMGQHSRILHTMYAFRRYPDLGCRLTGELLGH